MAVHVYNNQRKVKIVRGCFDVAFETALRIAGHADDDVEVTFVSNAVIAELNAQWRGKSGPTDCLSFPFAPDVPMPPEVRAPLGEIVISLEQAAAQGPIHVKDAAAGTDPFFSEVVFLFIHSLLHLIGFDHETGPEDERIMFERQEQIFAAVMAEIS